MKVEKIAMSVEELAEMEYAKSIAEQQKAITDYNIMMGNLEDPAEDEGGEEDE